MENLFARYMLDGSGVLERNIHGTDTHDTLECTAGDDENSASAGAIGSAAERY